jgi:phospholipid/cholesterol/gamma-HCH transport system permease protein
MKAFVETVGAFSIEKYQHLKDLLFFSVKCLQHLFQKRNYNAAVLDVLVVQIYFTSVQIIFLFLTVSIVFGSVFMGFILQKIKNMGLVEYLGDIMVGFVFIELVPFATVLLLALRTSSAINTEMAVMKVNGEIEALQSFKIDIVNYLFLPRIISIGVSALVLNCFFAVIVSISGFLFSNLFFDMKMGIYVDMILESVTFKDLVLVFSKNLVFAFFISVIPLHSGSQASPEPTAVPVSVLQGMVRVFIAIVLIEVSSLIIRSI